jgi:hypothetical protein
MKSMHPLAIALSGMSGCSAVASFWAIANAANFFYAAERRGPVAVIAGNDNRDQLAGPVLH